MNIKICGITSMKEMQQLDGMDIEFAGIVFNRQSRYYLNERISGAELKAADLDICKVGVFVNAAYEEIMETVQTFGLDLIQFEGSEPASFCKKVSQDISVIKTFFIDGLQAEAIDELIQEFDDACDYYAFDTFKKKDFSGITSGFDWNALAGARIEKPFFVGGGISPEDAAQVTRFRHPDFFGVDLNCFFEKETGTKDMAQVLRFKHELKQLSI
jgi:phosphoribosylanthranilate isomerase